MKKGELKKALKEAANWESQLTEWERSEIPYSEAKERVVNRVFEKYKNKLIEK